MASEKWVAWQHVPEDEVPSEARRSAMAVVVRYESDNTVISVLFDERTGLLWREESHQVGGSWSSKYTTFQTRPT
jgi:hypothetical protein